MKLAENYTSLYAIVGFPSITEPAHTLCSLLNFDLDILTVRSAEEVRHTLERLKQGGYRMVVCDMVTHTIAREMGFDAFLITSGIESLHSAIDQAVNISTWFGQLRQENLFLRSITQEQGGRVVVMEPDGSLFYHNMKDISPELHRCLQTHLREIPTTGSLKFYYTERSQLYSITAQVLLMNNVQRYLFYCVPSRIPLHSSRPGLRSLNQGECEYLFSNSFYSLSGAMGTQDAEINALAAVRQPLFICGEPGTGKEQIARYLYLHSALVNRPLVVANCAMMNDKSWDFLLNHYNSPLNANGNTVYFQNFEAIPEQWSTELLAAIEETGLARRVRLLFSRSVRPEEPVSPVTRRFIERLGALTLELPPLRSRSDEIPSLSSLYLNSLNLELGKQLSGFEPRAIEMLRQYPWPNNYTQFKNLLRSLATLTNGPYIRSSSVADLLSKERSLRSAPAAHPAAVISTDTSRTLESIIGEVVQQPRRRRPAAGHQPHHPVAVSGQAGKRRARPDMICVCRLLTKRAPHRILQKKAAGAKGYCYERIFTPEKQAAGRAGGGSDLPLYSGRSAGAGRKAAQRVCAGRKVPGRTQHHPRSGEAAVQQGHRGGAARLRHLCGDHGEGAFRSAEPAQRAG